MRNLYRTLKIVAVSDVDEVVRLHAQVALEEVDHIMRQFLQPKLQMTKKIYVTEVPDNLN